MGVKGQRRAPHPPAPLPAPLYCALLPPARLPGILKHSVILSHDNFQKSPPSRGFTPALSPLQPLARAALLPICSAKLGQGVGNLDLTTRQCSPEAEETFRRLTSPKFTVFRVWAGRRRSGHRWKCCCPPRAPRGSGPGPGRPSPTSAHTHIPAPRSAHTLLPLPSRPLAHTYLCAQHQNMTPVESFTPRGPPAPPMPAPGHRPPCRPHPCVEPAGRLTGLAPLLAASFPAAGHRLSPPPLALWPGSLLSPPLPGASPLPDSGLSASQACP